MERVILDILAALRTHELLDDKELSRILHEHNRRAVAQERAIGHAGTPTRPFAKKRLLPYVLRVRNEDPQRWRSWEVDEQLEERLMRTLRMKPRRTASGVATITVITKPWSCGNACLYCPNDVRMPKSYLHDEPACQRAERNWFDPYLQVKARLNTLIEMGHPCDKIELIVLGGTWNEYPKPYQVWFVSELFRALNEGRGGPGVDVRRAQYAQAGLANDPDALQERCEQLQQQVDAGSVSYNGAFDNLYRMDSGWTQVAAWQETGFDELEAQHLRNEEAPHRVVGLVIETRPDCITPDRLATFRRLGCTKVQIGVQSLDDRILELNGRHMGAQTLREAFEWLRVFGFKIHAHAMLNLYGGTPQGDVENYREFAQGTAFQPDEVKLYPCALIAGTGLQRLFEQGLWEPYDEEMLVSVLAECVLASRPYTRISRMIRDFSAPDIVAGNRKTNLRQLVENRLREQDARVDEIRFREISTDDIAVEELRLEEVSYETTATREVFLQWVTPQNRIAGFCRLSLPDQGFVARNAAVLPVGCGEAMIREVHVYGRTAQLAREDGSAQHRGLGKGLVERACAIARANGYDHINVISAVGTRGYYRKLGFEDAGLYQRKRLGL